ncbi:MAG: tannase/feruloyl esterase family alpha/beta hydrolase [Burkholderiales bacterium]|nr:tannase/feruloyl esterase family alpha/beta hydrolase [Burkholderiales bacterium]
MNHPLRASVGAIGLLTLIAACGGNDDPAPLPQLSAASGAAIAYCAELATRINFANTSITAATPVAAGTLMVAGTPVGAHCQVTGRMNQRTSAVDGNPYAIGFEMRLPNAWNGRFFHQANGGIDGSVVSATGGVNGGGGLTNALNMGFAVISSDAGHVGSLGPTFGIDPQARLDYGYQAAATLTPMAKSVINSAYGKGPDRSYFGGCSNGGRHTFIAATRMPEQYDGYLAGAPGYRLPLAAIANIFGAKQYASVASNPADISTGFTAAERGVVANAVLARCDALDGATDGLVQDTGACQKAFSFARDVPTCTTARDGTCLSAEQKTAIAPIFSGATDSTGRSFYSSFPFDSGLGTAGVASWEFTAPVQRDSGAVAMIWGVPPASPVGFVGADFVFNTSIDTMLASVAATNGTYTESALSFMLPPAPTNLAKLKNRGAKMMVYHGVSDAIFSSDDTTAWYDGVAKNNSGDASNFARFYRVPGMGHCSGGPSTDQFDMLTPLVNWVEKGQAPDSVIATARGAGNVAGANTDVPSTWSPSRTRPLCHYPKVAKYKGSGDIELAASFSCQ